MSTEIMITRTYRAAIRIGEDFITIEEQLCLPAGASDDQIAQAVDTGLRIYQAQRASIEHQVEIARAGRATSAPITSSANGSASYIPSLASDKQRNYIITLLGKAGWSDEDRDRMLAQWQSEWATLTRETASSFIELLKGMPPTPSALVNGQPPLLAAIAATTIAAAEYYDNLQEISRLEEQQGRERDQTAAEPPPPEPNGDDGDLPF